MPFSGGIFIGQTRVLQHKPARFNLCLVAGTRRIQMDKSGGFELDLVGSVGWVKLNQVEWIDSKVVFSINPDFTHRIFGWVGKSGFSDSDGFGGTGGWDG